MGCIHALLVPPGLSRAVAIVTAPILITALLLILLLVSKKKSKKRTDDFYARFYTHEELELLERNPDGSKKK